MPAAALKSLATHLFSHTEPQLDPRLLERKVVVLVQGQNSSGDPIYAYIELSLANLRLLRAKRMMGEDFNPVQFGTVVFAGEGAPTRAMRRQMAEQYDMVDLR